MQRTHLFLMTCLLLIGALCTSPAVADNSSASSLTGNELAEFCRQDNYAANKAEWFACVWYVYGVYDGYTTAGGLIPSIEGTAPPQDLEGERRAAFALNNLICIPSNVTRQQAALVVTKYLADNPAQLNEPASTLVLTAFMDAWPCPHAKP